MHKATSCSMLDMLYGASSWLCIVVILLFPFILTGCTAKQIPGEPAFTTIADKISLNGSWKLRAAEYHSTQLYSPKIDDSDWRTIDVPSNWYLQGIDQAGGTFWYRKNFELDPSLAGKSIRLVFNGVDYTADVWLNGRHLGFHEGYFGTFSFDISDYVQFHHENTLAVLVSSTMEEPERVWSLNKRQIKGVLNHHDTRPGGAWSVRGQEKNTGGIWAPVFLEISDGIFIEQVAITAGAPSGGKAEGAVGEAVIRLQVKCSAAECREVVFQLAATPKNFTDETLPARSSYPVNLTPGDNDIELRLPVRSPKLWWPYELGTPHLYELQVTASRNGTPLHQVEETFGFRTIETDPQTMVLRVNGERLFIRGTNYIGTIWLSEMDRDKTRRDFELMQDAHINAVRVHAHVSSPQLYAVADEMGILIWQDFPLQWGYSDDEDFIQEVRKQAEEMIATLYNHPSIYLWCGHNEPPWDADWMQWKYPRYNPRQNVRLDDELYAQLKKLDSSRFVHKYSATREHPWYGWYSGTMFDFNKPTDLPLISEFGAQSLPDLATLKTFIREDLIWPSQDWHWKIWQYHNFQPRETFELNGIEMGHTIDEFIANSQRYQARLTQLAAESYRRQRFSPVAGIYQFMFVEHWPSLNWGIVDYLRNPKPAYSTLKTSYQPLLPSIAIEKFHWSRGEPVSVRLWLINDHKHAFNELTLHTVLEAEGANPVSTDNLAVAIGADTRLDLGQKSWEQLRPGNYRLRLELTDGSGLTLATNTYDFSISSDSI